MRKGARARGPQPGSLAGRLGLPGEGPAEVLCLGAHCDDIEIGCGGSLLAILKENPRAKVTWVVFASNPERRREAEAGAAAFLAGSGRARVIVKSFRDGFLPDAWKQVKEEFEALKRTIEPDLVFTHYREDLHQDHRVVSELTWNTFRNPLILEYEIPKWDGDMGRPNVYCPLPAAVLRRKVGLIMRAYRSQAGKPWFTGEVFSSLARLRGMECNSTSGLAEAFHGRKIRMW